MKLDHTPKNLDYSEKLEWYACKSKMDEAAYYESIGEVDKSIALHEEVAKTCARLRIKASSARTT